MKKTLCSIFKPSFQTLDRTSVVSTHISVVIRRKTSARGHEHYKKTFPQAAVTQFQQRSSKNCWHSIGNHATSAGVLHLFEVPRFQNMTFYSIKNFTKLRNQQNIRIALDNRDLSKLVTELTNIYDIMRRTVNLFKLSGEAGLCYKAFWTSPGYRVPTHRSDNREADNRRQCVIGNKPTDVGNGPHHTGNETRQNDSRVDTRTIAHHDTVNGHERRARGQDSAEVSEHIVETWRRHKVYSWRHHYTQKVADQQSSRVIQECRSTVLLGKKTPGEKFNVNLDDQIVLRYCLLGRITFAKMLKFSDEKLKRKKCSLTSMAQGTLLAYSSCQTRHTH